MRPLELINNHKFFRKALRQGRFLTNGWILFSRWGLLRTLYLFYKEVKSRILRLPGSIILEACGTCNLNCPMCVTGRSRSELPRNEKMLSFEDFKKVIDDVRGFAVHLCLHYAGEPLLNKDIFRMIEYADKLNILTIISSNCVLLNSPEIRKKLLGSGLYKFHCSVDGATKETYQKYRPGADFEQVKSNILNLVKERAGRKTPIIALQLIATKTTFAEKEQYIALAKELGVDSAFFTTYYLDQYQRNPSKEELDDLLLGEACSRYERIENNRAVVRPADYVACPWLDRIFILSDGTVLQCCYDTKGEYTFGNAFEKRLQDIWNEPTYKIWRSEQAAKMKLPLCNQSCVARTAIGCVDIYNNY